MSESPPKWWGYLAIGLLAIVIGLVIEQARNYNLSDVDVTHFVVHLKDPSCQLRAYLMLNGHISTYFDSGDQTQQRLWALAKECHGWIEIEKPKHANRPYVPQGPSRTG